VGKAAHRDGIAGNLGNRFRADAAADLCTAALTGSTVAPRSELSARTKFPARSA
jgi:hypothetical protein